MPRDRNQNIYTGLYVNPGKAVRIRHKNSMKDVLNVQIVINSHLSLIGSDNDEKLQRFPDISRAFNIKSK